VGMWMPGRENVDRVEVVVVGLFTLSIKLCA